MEVPLQTQLKLIEQFFILLSCFGISLSVIYLQEYDFEPADLSADPDYLPPPSPISSTNHLPAARSCDLLTVDVTSEPSTRTACGAESETSMYTSASRHGAGINHANQGSAFYKPVAVNTASTAGGAADMMLYDKQRSSKVKL